MDAVFLSLVAALALLSLGLIASCQWLAGDET